MTRFSPWKGAVLGVLSSVVVIALAYLGARIAGLPFIPFDIFNWMARLLPGGLITAGIDFMVRVIRALNLGSTSETAKLAEQGIALVQFLAIGALLGLVLALLGRRYPGRLVLFGALGGLVLFALALIAEVSLGFPGAEPAASVVWLGILFIGWGALLGYVIQAPTAQPEGMVEKPVSRRQFLYLVGAGSVTVVVTALGLRMIEGEEGESQVADTGAPEPTIDVKASSGPAPSPSESELAARIEPAEGTRPELTDNDDFYRIDINLLPVEVDAETWRLDVTGLVERPLSLSLEDLRSRPAVSQAITLSCISNPVGGDLISTSVWTGVQLKEILNEAGLLPEAQELYIESADGFFESVRMEDMMDDRTLLVYAMNGEPLPKEHGFPLRIYIPNRYGMKQPKWITRMEAIDRQGPGYWVLRGWDYDAVVRTTSVIDAIATGEAGGETGIVPVGGIAFAGMRGISKVEVQVDDGPWEQAELRLPTLSELTWVQWRYEWRSTPGQHTLRVRAYDGEGQLQESEETDPHPAGATGIHSMTA